MQTVSMNVYVKIDRKRSNTTLLRNEKLKNTP